MQEYVEKYTEPSIGIILLKFWELLFIKFIKILKFLYEEV